MSPIGSPVPSDFVQSLAPKVMLGTLCPVGSTIATRQRWSELPGRPKSTVNLILPSLYAIRPVDRAAHDEPLKPVVELAPTNCSVACELVPAQPSVAEFAVSGRF
jgi:hypothetical protein